jgi:hypothetical protein
MGTLVHSALMKFCSWLSCLRSFIAPTSLLCKYQLVRGSREEAYTYAILGRGFEDPLVDLLPVLLLKVRNGCRKGMVSLHRSAAIK